jgi:hypothetical protein
MPGLQAAMQNCRDLAAMRAPRGPMHRRSGCWGGAAVPVAVTATGGVVHVSRTTRSIQGDWPGAGRGRTASTAMHREPLGATADFTLACTSGDRVCTAKGSDRAPEALRGADHASSRLRRGKCSRKC